MIKKYQEVFKLSDYEELVKSIKLVVSYVHYHYENNFDLATSWVAHLITHFRRLNTKREGVRYDKIKVSETISAKARVQRQNHLWCIIMNNYSQNAKHASFMITVTELGKDVKRMLCTGGRDPIDESEIDQFLTDIGFEADKFVNINDFAQFLLE